MQGCSQQAAGNGPGETQHPHNGTAYELHSWIQPLHQTAAAITRALKSGDWERSSPVCSPGKKNPSLEMTKTRPEVELHRLVQGHRVRLATAGANHRLCGVWDWLRSHSFSGTSLGPMSHCVPPSVKGSETRRRWQGSGDKAARSEFVLAFARLVTTPRIGAIHRHGRPTCSLAALTQPPRDLYSAIFLPEWRRRTCQVPVLSAAGHLFISPVISVNGTAAVHEVSPTSRHGQELLGWTGPHSPGIGAPTIASCEPLAHPRQVHQHTS